MTDTPENDAGKWWIGNDDTDPLHSPENDAACTCDLVTEGSPQWWVELPGLHHLEGCPMRPIPPGRSTP